MTTEEFLKQFEHPGCYSTGMAVSLAVGVVPKSFGIDLDDPRVVECARRAKLARYVFGLQDIKAPLPELADMTEAAIREKYGVTVADLKAGGWGRVGGGGGVP